MSQSSPPATSNEALIASMPIEKVQRSAEQIRSVLLDLYKVPASLLDDLGMLVMRHQELLSSETGTREAIIEECAKHLDAMYPNNGAPATYVRALKYVSALKNAEPQKAPSAGNHSGEDLPSAVSAPLSAITTSTPRTDKLVAEGPWRADREAMMPEEWYADEIITANGKVLAATITSPDGYEYKQGKINARLIAAAPDLLAALENLLAVSNSLSPEAQAARVAIAKTRTEPEWP